MGRAPTHPSGGRGFSVWSVALPSLTAMDPAPVADHPHPVTPDVGGAAAIGCPFPHAAPAAAEPSAARCPVPHVAAAPGCPVGYGPGGARRSAADLVVRKLLRIADRPVDLSDKAVYGAFQKSMLISAIRCTLTYVVFPFVLPTVHFLKGGAPVIGVIVGSVALVCDVFTIRRFFAVDHRYRWHFSAIAFSIMCLVATLWVGDVAEITRSLFG
ncbi:MAG: hypothetical protein JWM47_1371 [Acidimicrobiales bacterium]|nr:hypothetical protein [Acidimicrobiales bacterium]